MGVNLTKGQKVSITTSNREVSKISVGLGWHPNTTASNKPFDLDASAFLLNNTSKVINDTYFIFYNNPIALNGAVLHSGNNTTGRYDADAEQIKIDLKNLPESIEKIAISITINEALEKRQNFGMVNKAYVRIVDETSNEELIYFDLSNQFANETAIVAAEIYRYKTEWKFNAIGAGFHGGLSALCNNFGVTVENENQNQNYPINTNQQNMNYNNQNYNNQVQQTDNRLTCPQCKSSRVSGGKKGFGIGKAAIGTLLLGPIGLLGGFIGNKNLEFTCQDCNYKWTANSNTNTLKWLSDQANNTKNIVNKYLSGDLVDSLVAGCAIVAMSDGVLDPSERAKLLNYFSTSSEFSSVNLTQVEQKFNQYTQNIKFDNIMGKAEALKVVGKQRTKPDAARLIARLCSAIGYADGDFSEVEKRAVEEICRELSLNPTEFIG